MTFLCRVVCEDEVVTSCVFTVCSERQSPRLHFVKRVHLTTVYTHVCVHVCICVSVCACARPRACVCLCVHVCVWAQKTLESNTNNKVINHKVIIVGVVFFYFILH